MEQTNNAFARSTTHCKYLLTDSESADLAKVLHLGRRHRSKVLEYRAVATLDALAPSYTPTVPGGVTALPAPTFIFGSAPGAAVLPPYSPTTCDGYQYQERFQEDLSFQIQLTSNADERLRWQAGLYYLEIERYQAVSQLRDDGSD